MIDFGLSSLNYPVSCDNLYGYYGHKISSGADILFYLVCVYRYYPKDNFKKYAKKWLDIMFNYGLYQTDIDITTNTITELNNTKAIIDKDNQSIIYNGIKKTECIHDTICSIIESNRLSIPIKLWNYIINENSD